MKTCPFCAEQIQEQAIKCRYCGEFLDGRPQPAPVHAYYLGADYRSEAEFLGWPLVHIAYGFNPDTGLPRATRGMIAIGNFAVGLVAIGGLACGGLTVGGIGLGLVVLGGIAIGCIALGGLALAAFLAIGGLAVSAAYAIGGLALAPHSIGANGADPEFLRQLESWLPFISESFTGGER